MQALDNDGGYALVIVLKELLVVLYVSVPQNLPGTGMAVGDILAHDSVLYFHGLARDHAVQGEQ